MGLLNRKKRKKQITYERTPQTETDIKRKIDDNIKLTKDTFKDANDLVFREFKLGGPDGVQMFLCYIDGMADKHLINNFVLEPLMIDSRIVKPDLEHIKNRISDAIKSSAMTVGDFREVENMEDVFINIMSGETALFIDGYEKALIIATRSWMARGPSEPMSETVIRGPRDGFTETLRFNTALVRRRIKDTNLKIKQMQVGMRSKTDIALVYIDDIVNKSLVEEIEKKLKEISIDAVLESGYIEQFIEEKSITVFPQMQATERPDVVAGRIYEGRVAILVDNTPFALIIPTGLNAFLQSPEDYYSRPTVATFLRYIRLMSLILSVVAPAMYIALISFNPAIIPGKLLISIAASREGVPFPAFIEAFIMELTFELLREAGIRLPRAIGSTIGIVGGLVIGQSAVSAGIVSPIMVIIVAATAIASFAIPNYEVAAGFRLIRFILMILASIYGLYGVILGLIGTLIHLVNLKSFGVPFLVPIAPFYPSGYKDTAFFLMSWKYMNKRPEFLEPQDEIRQGGVDKDDSR
ncbi:MAG: spore germination protein [Clostridiales bacterium]|nr:spore germination protein [Clostridiales bacterium]